MKRKLSEYTTEELEAELRSREAHEERQRRIYCGEIDDTDTDANEHGPFGIVGFNPSEY